MAYSLPNSHDHVDVFVVDPQPGDYADFAASCAGDRFAFQFAASGDDALKLRPTSPRAVWLINVRLPDISGYELLEIVKSRGRQSVVCLVGDDYRPDDEIQSRLCGASLYTCKPVQTAWLAPWSLRANGSAPGRPKQPQPAT